MSKKNILITVCLLILAVGICVGIYSFATADSSDEEMKKLSRSLKVPKMSDWVITDKGAVPADNLEFVKWDEPEESEESKITSIREGAQPISYEQLQKFRSLIWNDFRNAYKELSSKTDLEYKVLMGSQEGQEYREKREDDMAFFLNNLFYMGLDGPLSEYDTQSKTFSFRINYGQIGLFSATIFNQDFSPSLGVAGDSQVMLVNQECFQERGEFLDTISNHLKIKIKDQKEVLAIEKRREWLTPIVYFRLTDQLKKITLKGVVAYEGRDMRNVFVHVSSESFVDLVLDNRLLWTNKPD